VKFEESNNTGMTLRELRAFVGQADAQGFGDDTRVRTVAKINGKMFKVSVDSKDDPNSDLRYPESRT
jgi:hypothetical protein